MRALPVFQRGHGVRIRTQTTTWHDGITHKYATKAKGTRAKAAAAADSTSNNTFGSGFKLGFLSPKGGKR